MSRLIFYLEDRFLFVIEDGLIAELDSSTHLVCALERIPVMFVHST